MGGPNLIRLAPPDRRAPVAVAVDRCPASGGCRCCPKKHRWDVACPYPHPPVQRLCSPPYPANIARCPEQVTMPQDPPPAPDGFRAPLVACCVECGRITPRRWTDPEGRVLPWCAGRMPDPTPI